MYQIDHILTVHYGGGGGNSLLIVDLRLSLYLECNVESPKIACNKMARIVLGSCGTTHEVCDA